MNKEYTLALNQQNVVTLRKEASQEVVDFALECATAAMTKHDSNAEVARAIKKDLDRKYAPSWHVLVGKSFGC